MTNVHHLQIQKTKSIKKILGLINSSENVIDEKKLIKECFMTFSLPPNTTKKYLDELQETDFINREKGEVWRKDKEEKPELSEEEKNILEEQKEGEE